MQKKDETLFGQEKRGKVLWQWGAIDVECGNLGVKVRCGDLETACRKHAYGRKENKNRQGIEELCLKLR